LLAQFAPGDAYSRLELDPAISPAALAHLRAEYLPSGSLLERFGGWAAAAGHGNLGYSLESHRPVLSLLRERAAPSAELILLGLASAWSVGLLLAFVPAWLGERARPGWERSLDWLLHAAAALLTALPLGVLAIAALTLAPVRWLPSPQHASPILPAVVLALAFLPTVYFQASHALAQVRAQVFMLQGRACGWAPWRLLLLHALPNTADVLVPVASLTVSQALVELVVLETLLGWPGLGQLSIEAAQNRDLPVLAGLVLLTSLVVIACNLGSELVQVGLNPRLRSFSEPAANPLEVRP
ncbi:MAG: ABC transporter permease subunit, partial [Chloroflexota bacterium]